MSYMVTIKRERFRAADNWVARDQDGQWRAYGPYGGASDADPQRLAEYLFHRDEIGKVQVVDGVTVAEILEL